MKNLNDLVVLPSRLAQDLDLASVVGIVEVEEEQPFGNTPYFLPQYVNSHR